MKALVLVAHADDETLGAGGTIRRLVQSGWEVDVVFIADGIVTARGTTEDNRQGARDAAAVLGIKPPTFLGFKDQFFDSYPVAEIASAAAALGMEPDLVITHSPTDLNKDHRIACEVAKIIARPRVRPIGLLACEIFNTAINNGAPVPANYYVDITETLHAKIEAFDKYAYEVRPFPHPFSTEAIRLHARYHGMQSGVRAAEAFTVLRGHNGCLP